MRHEIKRSGNGHHPADIGIVDYAAASQHFRDIIEQDYDTIFTSR